MLLTKRWSHDNLPLHLHLRRDGNDDGDEFLEKMAMIMGMNGYLHFQLYLHLRRDGHNDGDGWPFLPPSPSLS